MIAMNLLYGQKRDFFKDEEVFTDNAPGLPRFSECTFVGEYPFAHLRFDDPGVPVNVELEALDAIFSRRSVRQYANDGMDDAAVELLLKAAMSAPSAGNERPWHFVVIRDREILGEIPTFHPYAYMLEGAACAILGCGNETLQKFDGYWPQDCVAASQNLWIAATATGLGCVWLGVYPIEERVAGMRTLVGLPDHVVPFSLMALGRAASTQESREPRYDAGRVHRDRW